MAGFSFWMIVVATSLVAATVVIWLVSLFTGGEAKEKDGV